MKLKLFNFKTVNSTNDLAIKIIKNSNIQHGMIVAEKQNKGRGRYGKKWISFKGNLFVTIFFKLANISLTLKKITRINCYLIKKLLSFYYKKKIMFKSPNDLLVNKKKICGILQETLRKKNETYIITGIGINLVKSPKIKNYSTTNLLNLTKKKINKKEVVLKLKKIYEIYLPKINTTKLKKINLI